MMWNIRRSGYSDPFRLSPLGRVRVAVAWVRAPAAVSRWLLFGFVVCAVVLTLAVTVGIVMQAASPNVTTVHNQPSSRAGDSGPSRYVAPSWDKSHAGPSSSKLVDVPGISDCQPFVRGEHWSPHRDPFGEPIVLVVDETGTVWGPSCIVSAGRTSS